MQPLAGVRVLAVEQYGAGPFGTMYLANQGAEVIKIENPRDGGDMSRAVGPHFLGPDDSEFFHSFNANKRSVTLDLQSPEGQAVFHDLVRDADAVSNNLRGDVPEKLGIDYESLKAINPKIVCAHLTAYGRTGSRRTWPGFDYLMQAETGWFSLTGEPGTPPARFGLSVWVADGATNDPRLDRSCLPDRRIGRQVREILNVRARGQPAAPARSFSVLVSPKGAGQSCSR